MLAISDPYQSRVGFTAAQLQAKTQAKADARLAKELTRSQADRKLAKQLRRAVVEDPYYEEPQAQAQANAQENTQANTQPARRMGKSNKDIAKRQARIAARQQSDAALQTRLQKLQGSMSRPVKPAPSKSAAQYIIASPPRGKTRPTLPIQDIAKAFAATKRGRFESLRRGNMLLDLMEDIP